MGGRRTHKGRVGAAQKGRAVDREGGPTGYGSPGLGLGDGGGKAAGADVTRKNSKIAWGRRPPRNDTSATRVGSPAVKDTTARTRPPSPRTITGPSPGPGHRPGPRPRAHQGWSTYEGQSPADALDEIDLQLGPRQFSDPQCESLVRNVAAPEPVPAYFPVEPSHASPHEGSVPGRVRTGAGASRGGRPASSQQAQYQARVQRWADVWSNRVVQLGGGRKSAKVETDRAPGVCNLRTHTNPRTCVHMQTCVCATPVAPAPRLKAGVEAGSWR